MMGQAPLIAGYLPRLAEDDPLPPDHDRPIAEPAVGVDAYDAERRGLLAFLRRRTGVDRAPDVAQQAFLRVIARDPGDAPIRDLGAFLRRAALNLVRDEAKAARRRWSSLHVDADAVQLAANDQISALEARDLLRRLDVELADLNALTRDVFLAHRVDGYSYAEIAARTGLTAKAVERRMSKAIAHIDRVASSWR